MRTAGALVFCLPLALYLWTAAPGLTFVDSGELAAAATLLGIAHPTGYPLFTLLGRLVAALPGPFEPLTRLTWLSGLWVALGLAVFHRVARQAAGAAGLGATAARRAALGASLTLAVAATVWSQAVIVEVYALGFFFLCLLFWLALRAPRAGAAGELLFAYSAGLAAANHGSAAPLVPALALPILTAWGLGPWRAALVALGGGLAVLALPVQRPLGLLLAALTLLVFGSAPGDRRGAAWRLGRLLLAAVAGLTVYLYLPLRSALDPALDWGDPEALGPFLRHTSGQVFHVWFLDSWGTTLTQLGGFARQLCWDMTPLALAPMALGLAVLWRRQRLWLRMTVLVFVLNVAYASNYDIHDIASYFLPAITTAAVWMAVGLGTALEWLRRRTPRAAGALALTLLLPALAGAANFRNANRRHDHLVEDYSAAMFASLEPNAVILSRQWDQFCSASFYEQRVRGVRPDVTVVEKELMRRSWYLSQLARCDPVLFAPCRELAAAFRQALVPFENGGRYDAADLQRLYRGMIECLLEAGEAAGRPIYLTPDVRTNDRGLAGRYVDVPVGLAMRLYRERPESLPAAIVPEVRGLEEAAASPETQPAQLAGLVLEMLTRRAILEASLGRFDRARALLDRVLAWQPDYANARSLLERLRQLEAAPQRP